MSTYSPIFLLQLMLQKRKSKGKTEILHNVNVYKKSLLMTAHQPNGLVLCMSCMSLFA